MFGFNVNKISTASINPVDAAQFNSFWLKKLISIPKMTKILNSIKKSHKKQMKC